MEALRVAAVGGLRGGSVRGRLLRERVLAGRTRRTARATAPAARPSEPKPPAPPKGVDAAGAPNGKGKAPALSGPSCMMLSRPAQLKPHDEDTRVHRESRGVRRY